MSNAENVVLKFLDQLERNKLFSLNLKVLLHASIGGLILLPAQNSLNF